MEEKTDNILEIMEKHHDLIENLFSIFKDDLKRDTPKAAGSLAEFSWELKKHFFTEETGVFDFLPLKSFGIFETINHLKDEHLAMTIDLRKFADDFPKIRSEEIDNFGKLLAHHRELEEKELYPKLDKELQQAKKTQIVMRINQLPITNK